MLSTLSTAHCHSAFFIVPLLWRLWAWTLRAWRVYCRAQHIAHICPWLLCVRVLGVLKV